MPEGLISLSVVREFGGNDAPAANWLPLLEEHFVDDAETVPLAQIPVEIDVPSKNFRQLRCNRIGNAGRIRGAKQGISDFPGSHDGPCFQRNQLLRGGELASLSLHDDQAVLASDRKVEGLQLAGLADACSYRLAGAQLAGNDLGGGVCPNEFESFTVTDAEAAGQARQRVAALNSLLPQEGLLLERQYARGRCCEALNDCF